MGRTHFDAEVASIDVIAEEEIASLGRVTANLEQLHEIKVLAMHIPANGDWRVHFEKIGLTFQDLGALFDDVKRLIFGKTTLAVEVLFQELEVGFAAIMGREELILGGRMKGGRLDI